MNYRYLVIVDWDFAGEPPRLFTTKAKARQWVKDVHKDGWDEAKGDFKQGMEFEIAHLYRILARGKLEEIAHYETYAEPNGDAKGWVDGSLLDSYNEAKSFLGTHLTSRFIRELSR